MNWPETDTIPTTPAIPREDYDEPEAEGCSTAEGIKRRAETALSTGESYVRARPLTTLITALAVGAVVGALISQIGREEEEEEIVRDRMRGARDWARNTYGDLRDRVSEVHVPEMHMPQVRMPRNFNFHMPRFRREPTLVERVQDALGNLKFW